MSATTPEIFVANSLSNRAKGQFGKLKRSKDLGLCRLTIGSAIVRARDGNNQHQLRANERDEGECDGPEIPVAPLLSDSGGSVLPAAPARIRSHILCIVPESAYILR